MTSIFNECWDFIVKRSEAAGYPVVQDKRELEHVFNLMKDAGSYLEMGSAEGNSLYVLAHALMPGANITYVDYAENHTTQSRNEVIKLLINKGYRVRGFCGNSHDKSIIANARDSYDCVMIDAGHTFDDVMQDAKAYLPMAQKYCFFHDVELPEVRKAFEIQKQGKNYHYFIRSENYGYGIIKI